MDEIFKKHRFEDYPRESIANGITRRQLFSTLLTELHLFSEKKAGLAGMKSSNLGALSDEDIKVLVPQIVQGTKIFVRDNSVWALTKGEKNLHLFTIDEISSFAFNLINGRNTVDEIAIQLSQRFTLSYGRSFSITRGLFLTLVKLGVCLPVNNPSVG